MNTKGKEGTDKRATLLNSSLTGDNQEVATAVKLKLSMAAKMSLGEWP
jgi:hypothetical protein